ncbi:MAG: Mrp/NBP35 family ATP-binding protein [Phycisphaerales bacterium]
MPLTRDVILDALRTVDDPDLKRDLVSLNMVKDIDIQPDQVNITIELTTPACPMKDRIQSDIQAAVTSRARESGEANLNVNVTFTANVKAKTPQDQANENSPLPGVRHIVAVGAGKGGVGKSTVAVNLAVGLARLGARTGLLDGDIYGPSAPTMLGLASERPRMRDEQTMLPFEKHGIRSMSIGKLVPTDKALIWRGPMAHGAFRQLALQTEWGELDYLIVDLPPGTGDVPLSLCQMLPLSGAVVVCTPQIVAQDDARRAVRMFQQLGVDVLGVVENMSYFVGNDGVTYDLFGKGGAEALAAEMNLPFLGAVPIHTCLRRNGDEGTPLKNWTDSNDLARELDAVCQAVAQQVSINTSSGKLIQPTLSIR